MSLDPDRCPICGQPNECGMARGLTECWCFDVEIEPDVLENIPDEAQGTVCICARCAAGQAAPDANSAQSRQDDESN